MSMLILDSPSNDPRFNIAAEEYLMKETKEDYAFFYINDPSISIGKHQNALAEINLPWTRQHDIPVIRRMSGGGTVWHDRGNLNFSFILNGKEGELVNFRHYAGPVVEYLRGLGIGAEFGERNEILAGGLKISGNAEHIHRNRVLHHGTLLFSSDLSMLQKALDTDPDLYEDRAVQSIRSRVGNISDLLDKPMEIADFRRYLIYHVMMHFPGSEIYALSDTETGRIQELVMEKYSRWDWNMGYSPRYRLQREWMIGRIMLKTELEVEKGYIRNCRLTVLKQFLFPDDIPPGEKKKNILPHDALVTGARDYGTLDDILGKRIPVRENKTGDLTPGAIPEKIPADNAIRDAGRLKVLAESLIGVPHDPDALRTAISERDLLKPGWIDIFVKGLF
jgi:lipoate-protein ligase A